MHTSYLSPKPAAVFVGVSLYSVSLMHGTAYHQKQISGHCHLSDRLCSIQSCQSLWSAI